MSTLRVDYGGRTFSFEEPRVVTLGRDPSRKLPVQVLAALGLVGCLLLAVNLPLASMLAGFAVLAVGAAWYALRHARS